MNLYGPGIITALLVAANASAAQLQLLPDAQMPAIFGGGTANLELRWRNGGDEVTSTEIHARLFQTSSATSAPLGEMPWKNLKLLPGQTVLESARLDFPAVKVPTTILVLWFGGTNRLGRTEVLAYPTNLLGELKTALGGEILGVLDPENEFKPVLRQNGVEFADLEASPLEEFHGRLALVDARKKSPQEARRFSVPVIWILPPPKPGAELTPSFYARPGAKNVIVFAQPELIAKFPERPQAQLNLLALSKFALSSAAKTNSFSETSIQNSP